MSPVFLEFQRYLNDCQMCLTDVANDTIRVCNFTTKFDFRILESVELLLRPTLSNQKNQKGQKNSLITGISTCRTWYIAYEG